MYQADFWNERFDGKQYAYGESPNDFVKKEIAKLKPGKALCPAEGEGRNAVYLASLGWEVTAFDISSSGKQKALNLASQNGVTIDYKLLSYTELAEENEYDLVVAVFNHMIPEHRKKVHQAYVKSLKSEGIMLLEGFHTSQLGLSSGGPKDLSMLLDEEIVLDDFKELEPLKIVTISRILNEGPFHQGEANVIQFTGKRVK